MGSEGAPPAGCQVQPPSWRCRRGACAASTCASGCHGPPPRAPTPSQPRATHPCSQLGPAEGLSRMPLPAQRQYRPAKKPLLRARLSNVSTCTVPAPRGRGPETTPGQAPVSPPGGPE